MLREEKVEHLLRRAGFGASQTELSFFVELGSIRTQGYLVNFEELPDDVDSKVNEPGYVGVTARAEFLPETNITDARQLWLFRMLHTQRPLQEKMALFWHNHFATAYSKIAGLVGANEATRMLFARPNADQGAMRGQIQMLRQFALGNFRDLLVEVAKDPAMLVWLDGRTNVKGRPQENFGRELLELFTMGVGHYTEEDVYAAARVFTGWNLRRAAAGAADARYEFAYNAAQHDTDAKQFTFPIYADGRTTIPARSAANGMQDGLDLIDAVARHPATGPRLARRLWAFFVSEREPAPQEFVDRIAGIYYESGYNLRHVVRLVLGSPEFNDPSALYARYSWPVEFVVRSLKEAGWTGFSVNSALTPLINMGQQLFEPPDVNGWELGPGWFTTSAMLARMNFAAALTTNQRVALRDDFRATGRTAEGTLSRMLDRLTAKPFEGQDRQALMDYLLAGRAWSGSDADLLVKVPGLAHLVMASGHYQIV